MTRALNVTTEVRNAVARLPDGAAVTLEAVYDSLARIPGGAFENLTGHELRERIQNTFDLLKIEHVITDAPGGYRKGQKSVEQKSEIRSQRSDDKNLTEPPQTIRESETMTDTKELKKMSKQIDLRRVEELAAQGVAISQVGVELGKSDGYGSYQAKHNPDFLAAFNRGRATAKLEPFHARKSPNSNGNGTKAGSKIRNSKSAIRNSILPPPATVMPLTSAIQAAVDELRRRRDEIDGLIVLLEKVGV